MIKKKPDDPETVPYPQHLSPKQAAERAGLSKSTIYKYCQEDANPQIPHKRGPDGLILIPVDGLDHWFVLLSQRPPRRRRGRKSSS